MKLVALERAALPLTKFEEALGGRKAVIESLVVDSTPAIQRFVKLLLDPEYDQMPFGELASHADITLTELLRAYRNATLAKAQILAVNEIAKRLPQLAADVMERALPQPMLCPVCRGETTIPGKFKGTRATTCQTCEGTGKVMRPPSASRQRLALEIAEVLKPPKGGPALLQANFNITPAAPSSPTAPGSLEQLQAAVSHILFPRAIEATATPVEPEADDVR